VALTHLDGRRVGHEPVHDRLTVAHVVFFDVRAFTNTAQLHQRVAGVRLVLGQHDVRLMLGRQQPALRDLRLADEVQRHQIRPRFFERRVLLLEHELRLAV